MCLLAGGGVVLAFFFSALFSKASQVSFFGTMFDIGTFWFIFSAFLLMLLSSIILGNPKNARIVLFGTILSSGLVLIFQTAHLFMPGILSLGVLADKTSNVLGSWNALGLFAGFSALVLLLVVEFFPTTRIEKLLFQALTIIAMFLIAAVNFPLVWVLLGFFTLIIFVYKVSVAVNEKFTLGVPNDTGAKAHFPVFSFFIIVVSLFFFISGQFIGGFLPTKLGLSNNEVSPSFEATMMVAKSVLKEDPVFGLGPNRFLEAWAMHKSEAINTTQFWDVSFSSGSGLLPSLVATTGSLGILAWLAFFVLLILGGLKSIFSSIKNSENWETMAFFVLSVYLFAASFFYSGGTVLFLLALAFAGVFVGLSGKSAQGGEISVSFLDDHRKSFLSILFIILVIIISAALAFKYAERFSSVSYFGKALKAPDVPSAEEAINKALALYVNDLYLRTYAQVYLVKLDSLVKKVDSLSDAEKTDLQTSLTQAKSGAEGATLYNPINYLNFKLLGSVYQAAATLGVKDIENKAVEAYKTASNLNPLNPGLKLNIANASIVDKKIKEAKDYANAAIVLKPDFIEALILLSQIAKSESDNKGALSFAEKALSIAPTNQDLIKYVDSLKVSNTSEISVPSNTDNKTKDSPAKKQ
ncbi:hypothetical protein A2818_01535 [Candidatus Nomurabacteria bacterium RIFCSPHIGHO2_01_FULL_40_12]|uniref:Uncharacterized protein n=1 Tax=Candidatus Nomurabacteria bacterium RIFCSPHIGHO2_01_FULL_40_12 TaxID=1801737 RepID=A0A1F6V013_9BACT|nr:MAG: hypothetical protein A2818_01535 [Candidatus Nomurabacteria bacterium RIFCSPHIGHO2_01_FULL_40_12]